MDDVTGGAGCDVAAHLGVEDPASHRSRCQVLGSNPGAPCVELTRDREVFGGTLVHRADDFHRSLSPAQHVVAGRTREADQVGDDFEWESAGECVDGFEGPLSHEVGDERLCFGFDPVLEPAKRTGGQIFGESGAQCAVERRVGGQ